MRIVHMLKQVYLLVLGVSDRRMREEKSFEDPGKMELKLRGGVGS
jgi:hypothetical protein